MSTTAVNRITITEAGIEWPKVAEIAGEEVWALTLWGEGNARIFYQRGCPREEMLRSVGEAFDVLTAWDRLLSPPPATGAA